jgi:hypothetical protein
MMPVDLKTGASSQEAAQLVQVAFGKLDHAAAVAADQVMGVAAREPGIVAVAVVRVDVLDQAVLGQQLQRPIDAGQADPRIDLAGAPVELGDLQVLRCGVENLQDHAPRAGQAHTQAAGGFQERWAIHGTLQLRNILKMNTTGT